MSDLQDSHLPTSDKPLSEGKINEEHFDIEMLDSDNQNHLLDDKFNGLSHDTNNQGEGEGDDDQLLKDTLASVANNITASNALADELSGVSEDVAAAVVEAVAAVTATAANADSQDRVDNGDGGSELNLPKELEAHLNNAAGGDSWDGGHPMDDEELQLHFQKVIEREEEQSNFERSENQKTGKVISVEDSNEQSIPNAISKEVTLEEENPAKEAKEDSSLIIPSTGNRPSQVHNDTGADESSSSSNFESYKGLTIPANSELFKTSTSALDKYAKLQASTPAAESSPALIDVQLSALPLTLSAPTSLPFNVQLLIHTLPVLDNLASQILRIIAQGPYEYIMEIVANADSTYSGIAFTNLVNIFETTKKIYNSDEHPFFTVEDATNGLWKFGQDAPTFLKGKEDSIESTLRKINLATFLVATLGLVDLGFFYLNEAFLDVFCPPQPLDPAQSLSEINPKAASLEAELRANFFRSSSKPQISTKFLKSHALLYLDLKTQAFISAIELNNEGSRNVDGTIRKNISNEEILNDLFPNNLDEILYRRKDPEYDPKKTKLYRNSMFFTPSELDFLIRCDNRKSNLLKSTSESSLVETYEWVKFLNDLLEYVSKNVGFLIWGPNGKMKSELESFKRASSEPESIIGNKRFKGLDMKYETTSLDDSQKDQSSQTDSLDFYKSYYHSSQKAKPQKKKTPLYRRVWTKEEEDILIEGLKEKGTQWSAILSLYGKGGSVNEILKNRTTLQMKDKARNWKYYYLRRSLAIPDYLSNVTGELENYPQDSTNTVSRPKTGMLKDQQQLSQTPSSQAESSVPESQQQGLSEIPPSAKEPEPMETIGVVTESHTSESSKSKESEEVATGAEESSNYEDLIKDFFAKQTDEKESEENKSKRGKDEEENKAASQGDSMTAELNHLVAEAFR